MSYIDDWIETSLFKDWIEPNLYKDCNGKSILFPPDDSAKDGYGRLINLKPKTLVMMLDDLGIPDNQYKEMVLDIAERVKKNKNITDKQKIVLLKAVFY